MEWSNNSWQIIGISLSLILAVVIIIMFRNAIIKFIKNLIMKIKERYRIRK